jgi:hypothetical protein
MHRSGTSLLARFLHCSDIDLGDDLIGAKKSNIYGHYEDVGFVEFHSKVLRREFGHPMWVPAPAKFLEEDRNEALKLIATREHKPRWGWKDPRTSLFLEFWRDLLPDAQFLFVMRDPSLVVDSLSRRVNTKFYQFWSHNTFLRAWLIYNQNCFAFYQKRPSLCMFVVLEDVLQHTDAFVNQLSEWLAFELDTNLFDSLYDPTVLKDRTQRALWAYPWLRSASTLLYEKIRQGE